jgi:Spy/CpxP family protein refolding chaperone
MNRIKVIAIAAAFAAPQLHAQAPPIDPVGSKLFPPDFIAANAQTISLNESQQQKLHAAVEQVQARFGELGPRVRGEAEALGKLIDQAGADRSAVMAQFEKLQGLERELKRAQLELLLDLRGMLNEEQLASLTKLKEQMTAQMRKTGSAGGGPAEHNGATPAQMKQLQEKAERVKAGAEKWQSEGRDPAPIAEIMQQVGPLVQSGKYKEASELLDRALKILE